MSSLTTLARPYAKAAFELAQSEQDLAGWDERLTLASEIALEESMAGLLESPHVQASQVVGIMTESAGEAFSDRFRNFLSVLGANERLPLLPQITTLYRQLLAGVTLGYRLTQGVSDLPGVAPDDLEGVSLGILLQLGG